jgi:Xaa-Pro aminopeptidase
MKFGEHNYPESVLTHDRKGNYEVRNLIARGEFVLHDYRNPSDFSPVDSNKQKLYLKEATGTITEYFLIPSKNPNQMLLIRPKEKEAKDRMVWNEKVKREEELWKGSNP